MGTRIIVNNDLSTIEYDILKRNLNQVSKDTFGTVGIIGGSFGMHGALYLVGRSAFLLGSGKVIIASNSDTFTIDYMMPEIMVNNPEFIIENLHLFSVIVIGNGLDVNSESQKILQSLINNAISIPVIFDADALNIMSKDRNILNQVKDLPNKIITPHIKEASRLLNCDTIDIQNDRIEKIFKLYEKTNAIILLKGYESLICDGKIVYINKTGNATLSNAGQGDTLSGMIASFIAQKMSIIDSLRFATYLHGLAGEFLAKEYAVSVANGILASEISTTARKLLNQILYKM